MKTLLFSVTRKDFEMQVFRSGGKGGQNQNKVSSGVRLIHRASGARGEARDSRDQFQNKQSAFRRLLQTKEWKAWHMAECARRLGQDAAAREAADRGMEPANLRVEVQENGRWVDSE
jgi:protein subunit release factor B